jgi:hypothetical protein
VEILGPVSVDYLPSHTYSLTKKESATKQTATARRFYKQAYAVTSKNCIRRRFVFFNSIRPGANSRKSQFAQVFRHGLRAPVAWLRTLIVAKVPTGPALN